MGGRAAGAAPGGERLFLAFVDLTKAFDSLNRPALWAVLRHRGLPEQLISILADLHSGTTTSVRVGSTSTVALRVNAAGLLFNLYLDHVVREAVAAPEAEAAHCSIQLGVRLGYREPEMLPQLDRPQGGTEGSLTLLQPLLADDSVASAESAVGLQLFMRHFEAACDRWGLTISSSKTERMVLEPRFQLSAERRRSSA